MTLPVIPENTVITLEPADRFPCHGRPVSTDNLHVQVLRVHPAGEGVAWVLGHLPECSWPGSDCDQPWCVEVIASVAALRRAAGRVDVVPRPETEPGPTATEGDSCST